MFKHVLRAPEISTHSVANLHVDANDWQYTTHEVARCHGLVLTGDVFAPACDTWARWWLPFQLQIAWHCPTILWVHDLALRGSSASDSMFPALGALVVYVLMLGHVEPSVLQVLLGVIPTVHVCHG